MSLTSLSTLATLELTGPRRITDLAANEGVTQPSMTALVTRSNDRDWWQYLLAHSCCFSFPAEIFFAAQELPCSQKKALPPQSLALPLEPVCRFRVVWRSPFSSEAL